MNKWVNRIEKSELEEKVCVCIGYPDLITNDSITTTDLSHLPFLEGVRPRRPSLSRAISLDQSSTLRPIGIAEPLRRLSTGLIRAFKSNENDEDKHLDKSVQVTTIIRRCGRCAEVNLPIRPVRQHSTLSISSASMTDNNSSCDEDDVMDYPPPNLDRIRQRRATLVAKTIISQMATQPRSSSIDELISPLTLRSSQRQRSGDSSPTPMRYSVKISSTPPPSDSPNRRKNSEEQFSEISKQISSLLTPSDEENEIG